MFDLKAAGYRDPVLVSSTDGVGTKLKIAIAADNHATIGIDLVAMSVNDLVVQGAEPLFFLDYFATGHLDVTRATAVIAGIADGCRQAGCALIGGETAEMPGMYAAEDYDLAGFAVGAVERDAVITGETVVPGDVVLGLAASGPHSNGYSLVRRIVEKSGVAYDAPAPFAPAVSLGDALLAPTRIYVRSCLAAIRTGGVKSLAHITGGGLLENIPRVIPESVGVVIDMKTWPMLPVFQWLAREGEVAAEEMARAFNCGIGMMAVVSPDRAPAVRQAFEAAGETVHAIGSIVARKDDEPSVVLDHMEDPWRA